MKELIFLLSIILISCQQKHNDIENIEVINYRSQLDTTTWNFRFFWINYSIIDGNGNAQTMSRITGSEFLKYKIDETILDEISNQTVTLNSEDFIQKKEDFTNQIYCGINLYTRIRIKYYDKESLSFVYLHRTFATNKYRAFEKLNFEYNRNKWKVEKIVSDDTINLIKYKKDFENFTKQFKGDLLYPTDFDYPKFK